MQVSEYGNSGIINQEIYTTRSTRIEYNKLFDSEKYANILH